MVRSKEGIKASLLGQQSKGEYLVIGGALLWLAKNPKIYPSILSLAAERFPNTAIHNVQESTSARR